MKSRTHITVSNAVALMAIRPNNIKELVICMTLATVGGTISDLDLRTSDSHKLIDFTMFITGLIILIGLIIDDKYKYGIVNRIINGPYYLSIVGILLFLLIVFYGIHKPHRSFMHSITCMIILSSILYICFNNLCLPFIIGFITHIILDILNKRRVQIFFPIKRGISLNLIEYGGKIDNLLFLLGIVVIILNLYI